MFKTVALALAAATASLATHAAEPVRALHCGQFFDARSGKLLDARTVVVRDGKVAEVLPGRASVADAQIIDLSGHTCSPGWTDLHVHLGSQSSPQSYSEGFRLDDADFAFRSVGYAKKTLLAGFTSVRDLGGEVSPHLRDAINQGLVDGPRIWAAGKSHRHHRRPRRSHQRLQRRARAPGRSARPHRGRGQFASTTRARPCASATRTAPT